MNPLQIQGRSPSRALALGASLGLILLVDFLHVHTGLAYEFHVLFILPVMLAAWFTGALAGYGVALTAAASWFLADYSLGGAQSDPIPLLFNTAMRLLIFLLIVLLLTRLRGMLERETRLAREDSLTGLPNRREFMERGHLALTQARRLGAAFTAVFIDLDHFKAVNDRHGHEAGDAVLRAVAEEIRAHLRIADIPGRLGGDEFALLLPGMKAEAAGAYLDKLRERMLQRMGREGWPVTFSIGATVSNLAPEDFDAFLARADARMYLVKAGGRNAVSLGVEETAT